MIPESPDGLMGELQSAHQCSTNIRQKTENQIPDIAMAGQARSYFHKALIHNIEEDAAEVMIGQNRKLRTGHETTLDYDIGPVSSTSALPASSLGHKKALTVRKGFSVVVGPTGLEPVTS